MGAKAAENAAALVVVNQEIVDLEALIVALSTPAEAFEDKAVL